MQKVKMIRKVVGLGLLATAGASQAAVDVTAVTGELASAVTTVGTIGAAALAVVVVVKVFKYIRGAF